MRRALRIVLVVGLVLGLLAAATGLAVMRSHSRALAEGATPPPTSGTPLGVLHVVSGHGMAAALSVAAAMAFLLGLQGLLEPRGMKRLAGAALFLTSPLLMSVAWASDLSGYARWDEKGVAGAALAASFRAFVQVHGVRLALGALGGIAVFMALTAWAAPPTHPDDEERAS